MTISSSDMHRGKNHRKILLKRKEDGREIMHPTLFNRAPD
jgi:hypothetical protein